jgi:hypothetical protein
LGSKNLGSIALPAQIPRLCVIPKALRPCLGKRS